MSNANPYAVTIPAFKSGIFKTTNYFLFQLDIELTERCNNNCIHCYINLPKDDLAVKNKELATDEIKNILAQAVSLGCLSVRFTGGEPLLRADFEELYIFARKLGLKILLFTNATLITHRLIGLFARIPPLKTIEVSVYGMKKESYEAVTRTPGSFKKAFRGIGLLLDNNIPFVVKGALLPQNKNEIDEFEAWSKTIPWMDKNKPIMYSMFFDLRGHRDDSHKNKFIENLRINSAQGLKILTRHKSGYIREMKRFCAKFMGPAGNKLFSCGAGYKGCVGAYGNFQPCLPLRHPDCVYDLKQGTLKDAVTNFFPKLRQMKAQNPDYLARCAKCFLKSLCNQCPAKSWMEYGTLDAPVNYLCQIAHAQARFLGMIGEKENAWDVIDWQERIKKFTAK